MNGDPHPLLASLHQTPCRGQVLHAVTATFRQAGLETPGLDARRLVSAATCLPLAELLAYPEAMLSVRDLRTLEAFAHRRLAFEPVSRILGWRSFHGFELEISPATLDPRPETETLVEGVLALSRAGRLPGGEAPRLLDLGTGSGAILIALLAALPGARGLGVDISRAALQVAERNASRHGVSSRCALVQGDWLEGIDGVFDVIVSNPPYLERAALTDLAAEVSRFDPVLALDGDVDGLAAYRRIVPAAAAALAEEGWLVMEVGEGQAQAVAELCRQTGSLEIGTGLDWRDPSGIERCVAFRSLR